MANPKITIFNSYYDEELDKTIYKSTVIDNVHWESIEGYFRRAGNNIVSKDSLRLFIPFLSNMSNKYVTPFEFNNLENKDGYFTITTESLVIKGDYAVEIDSLANLRELGKYYTITSVDPKNYGSRRMRHWEVMAK